jgi:hypothetical protein
VQLTLVPSGGNEGIITVVIAFVLVAMFYPLALDFLLYIILHNIVITLLTTIER